MSEPFQSTDIATLLDQLDGVAIWTVGEMGRFEYLSDGFEDIWGLSPEEVRNDPETLLETIHPDDRAFVRAQIEQPPEEVTEVQYENRIVRPDGDVRWLKIQQVPLHDEEGRLETIVGICTDITEEKRREEELDVLNRVLRHDIRNDMAVVLGWLELLEDRVDESGQEYLAKTLAAGEHIVELTELARDYAELVMEDVEGQLRPIPLRSVLQTELDIRGEAYPEVAFVLRGDIPDVEVLANDMLSSVFRNILNNAVQQNDTDDPRVTLEVEETADDVVVHIADNGPGIPPELKGSLFAERTAGMGSAGGMGLYIVETLVTEYGGEVSVEDVDPTGTVFHIRLRRAD